MDRLFKYGAAEAVVFEYQILGKIFYIFAAGYQLMRQHPAACLMIRLKRINIGPVAADYADLSAGAVGKFFHGEDTAYGNDIVDKFLKIHFCFSFTVTPLYHICHLFAGHLCGMNGPY